GTRAKRSIASAVLTAPFLTALRRAQSPSRWTCPTCTSCRPGPPLRWPWARRLPQPTQPCEAQSEWGQTWGEGATLRRRGRVMTRRGGGVEGHLRQDKHGFPVITCPHAAIGSLSCWLASQR